MKMKCTNIMPDITGRIAEDFISQNPELFDIVFEFFDGQKLYAHKYRLSVISPIFKAMLSDIWTTKDEPIPIKDYSFKDFKEFLLFLYSGKCDITDENIFVMLDMAEFYQIKYLKKLCDQYLSMMELNLNNIFEMLEICNKYSMTKMRDPCHNFIAQNFFNFVKCEKFLNADKSVIEEIATFTRILVKPEEIFQAIYQWSEHRAIKKQNESDQEIFDKNDAIKAEITPFLPHIRFGEMKRQFVNEHVANKGFLFSGRKLINILKKANATYKVTVTNLNGQSISGKLPTDSETIELIESLQTRKCTYLSENGICWKTECTEIPSTPSRIKKKPGIEWYLLQFYDGDIGIGHFSQITDDLYLLAEMRPLENGKFICTKKCRIKIE